MIKTFFALKTEDFIDRYSQIINENASITELFELVKSGNKNIYAVVDDNKKLKGILTLDDIRPYLFNKEMDSSQTVFQIMKAPPAILHRENKPLDILQTFDDTGVWNLPVVSAGNDFIGFISKSSILMSYRQLLKEYSD